MRNGACLHSIIAAVYSHLVVRLPSWLNGAMSKHTYYFDDLTLGATVDLGKKTVSEEEILRFGREFDPQPFHVDPEAARDSIFGGIIASGWHTCSITMRLLVDEVLSHSSSLGSPGVEQIRWVKPVRPGDTLHAVLTVQEVRHSQSKPDRGTARIHIDVTNQADELVMWMESFGMFAKRQE
jgi:acyl dehydratase